MAALVRRGLAFVVSFFFEHRARRLYEYALQNLRSVNEANFAPRIDHTQLKIVGSNDVADQLEAEGLESRFHRHNLDEREALDAESTFSPRGVV